MREEPRPREVAEDPQLSGGRRLSEAVRAFARASQLRKELLGEKAFASSTVHVSHLPTLEAKNRTFS